MLPFIISAATLALTTPPVVLYRRPISVVQFTGADRKRFLHGLCTVDVNSLAGCAETAVVDAAGNALDLLTLVDGADEDSLLALGDGGRGAELAQFFDKYAFPADQVEVSDASERHAGCCLEIAGPMAKELLSAHVAEALPPPGGVVSIADGLVLGAGSLGFAESYALLLTDDAAAEASHAALATAVGAVDGGVVSPSWEELRVRRGRPARGAEYAAEHAPKASPLSLGLWGCVTPDKGCYLGNEVLVRLARAKRQQLELYGVKLEEGDSVPSLGDSIVIVDDEKPEGDPFAQPQGVITSVNSGEGDGEPPFALALLRPQAAKIGVRVKAGGAACGEVVDLPFAVRFREGLGGDGGESEGGDAAAEAKAAAKAAEAERKAKKMAAMQAKLKEMGLA